jgi:formylglycine-generating enzyme required for sulfatase activity
VAEPLAPVAALENVAMRPDSAFDALAIAGLSLNHAAVIHRLRVWAKAVRFLPAVCLNMIAACLCVGTVCGSDLASAQGQSDQLGLRLGTVPKGFSTDSNSAGKGALGEPIYSPITMRAGQSVVMRAGASTFSDSQAASLAFKLGRRPACGMIWETPQGIVLKAKAECVGQTLEFDYRVSVAGASGTQPETVKVAVQALVQSGIETCGMSNAPYEFIKIPGGSYSFQNPPSQLSDLVALVGRGTATVEPFCITEELVPASEMEAFLAEQTPVQKREAFPEAIDAMLQPVAQVETGRGVRSPALAVSYRMAKGYAQRLSDSIGRALQLPRLEQYAAAAVYLQRQRPDAPSTHSFFVSLRGGAMEWSDTPCNAVQETFALLGTNIQSGGLNKYCYESSQRVARMSFRLVSSLGM